jgi:uncharacterized protein with GYD domain
MLFITLARFRTKPTKQVVEEGPKRFEALAGRGVKLVSAYWTFGRYDVVLILEAPEPKAVLHALVSLSDVVSTETLLAIPREEAVKVVE